MGRLSELVQKDYEGECDVIRETGKPVLVGIGIAVGLGAIWLASTLLDFPWTGKDYFLALLGIFVGPLAIRRWQRYEAMEEMRHHREVRMDMKLNALLGIVNIQDPPESDDD